MKFRKLSKREKTILYATLFLGFVALVFEFIIVPFEAELDRLNQSISKKSALLKRYSSMVARGEDIASLYESYKKTFQTGADAEVVTVNLFKDIRNAANKFGLSIEGIKPLSSDTGKEYSVVSLDVELVGDFTSIFKFIHHLEKIPSFTRVLSFRVSPMGRNVRKLRCRVVASRLFI